MDEQKQLLQPAIYDTDTTQTSRTTTYQSTSTEKAPKEKQKERDAAPTSPPPTKRGPLTEAYNVLSPVHPSNRVPLEIDTQKIRKREKRNKMLFQSTAELPTGGRAIHTLPAPAVPISALVTPTNLPNANLDEYYVDPAKISKPGIVEDVDFLAFTTALGVFFDNLGLDRKASLHSLLAFFAVNGTSPYLDRRNRVHGVLKESGEDYYYNLQLLYDQVLTCFLNKYTLRNFLKPFAATARCILTANNMVTAHWARAAGRSRVYPPHFQYIAFDFADGLKNLKSEEFKFVCELKRWRLRAREIHRAALANSSSDEE